MAIVFSPDGKTLASASHDGTIRLWDAATGTYQQTLKGHWDSVTAMAFSPDVANGSPEIKRTFSGFLAATGQHV
ncbi:uncharacterized protein DNG_09622 [Cephalotrichum gorgonifer]|uniref:Uncharacterized protein n=1 Tax=Cephalotrichum gorgonifer TaxID=2041049 RepID=A0AAE8SZL6_9PEZI|nr:uncharacterized protein DNG_09622 [Cephalotrichum gorgonifer]